MIEVKEEYPYIDEQGQEHADFIRHYAKNENGERFFVVQDQTGVEYEEAVDRYPTNYTYSATDKKIETEIEQCR